MWPESQSFPSQTSITPRLPTSQIPIPRGSCGSSRRHAGVLFSPLRTLEAEQEKAASFCSSFSPVTDLIRFTLFTHTDTNTERQGQIPTNSLLFTRYSNAASSGSSLEFTQNSVLVIHNTTPVPSRFTPSPFFACYMYTTTVLSAGISCVHMI